MDDDDDEERLGQIAVSNDHSRAVSRIAGFVPRDFNLYGRIPMWRIAEYLEWIRIGTKMASSFLYPLNKYTLFLRACRYRVGRELHMDVPDVGEPVVQPLHVEHRLTALGKSSYTVLGRLRTDGGERKSPGSVLVESLTKVVRVNPSTKSSMPFDEDVELLRPHCDGLDLERVDFAEIQPEDDVFDATFTVLPTHTDFNHHTNHAAYLLFCEDTAALAAANNIYSSVLVDEFAQQGIDSCTIYYEKESKQGDTIRVETWETPAARQLHFRVSKEKQLLCYATMMLHNDM